MTDCSLVEALKLLSTPLVPYIIWELFATPTFSHHSNPFELMFGLSHRAPTSDPADPRYLKGYFDLLFVAYYIVFFSFVRQIVTVTLLGRAAKYFGIKRESKVDRFGEQGYFIVYFLIFGAWGFRIMSQHPTWWYRTEHFWIDQPHWVMQPEMKRYYLMQMAFWFQQLIVLVLGLEKPRKDFKVLVMHHIVTLWMICGGYMINLTLIGNAVFVSMDIPDMLFSVLKVLHYIGWIRAKLPAFVTFVCGWAYFRHYLNLRILQSVWAEWELSPKQAQAFIPAEGIWLAPWVRYQVFVPLVLLQALNIYWFVLILRVVGRTVVASEIEDERSDDENEE
ncbi:TLC domain-containing protein [Mycena rebaudengoi]|nr:TLC domain-containing protein [Mycena rebaudengoi]